MILFIFRSTHWTPNYYLELLQKYKEYMLKYKTMNPLPDAFYQPFFPDILDVIHSQLL